MNFSHKIMNRNIFRYLTLGILLSTIFVSCRKDKFLDDTEETKESGTTYVKVLEGPQKSVFLDAMPGIGTINVFNIRKDAASQAMLNTSTKVTLTAAPELIAAYNAANPVGGVANTYETLPDGIFTAGEGLTKTATGYTLNFNAGDFAKDFKINLNFGLFDFSKKYALAFKITDAENAKVTPSSQKQIIALISVKNAYDGIYACVTGTVQRFSAPGVPTVNDALNGTMAGNPDVTVATVNSTTVLISNLRWFGGTSSIAGIDNLQAIIDPATNLVTMRALGNATLANTPGAVNKYDPATKTFTLNFTWNPTANVRTVTDLTLKYKASR